MDTESDITPEMSHKEGERHDHPVKPHRATKHAAKTESHKPKLVLLGLAVIMILGFLLGYALLQSNTQKIDRNGYQVVQLANGQTYVGKLKSKGGDYLILESPYISQAVQTPTEEGQPKQEASTTLIKVSDQIYGPDESIALNKDQVLFWQNLRSDSKVTQAINEKD